MTTWATLYHTQLEKKNCTDRPVISQEKIGQGPKLLALECKMSAPALTGHASSFLPPSLVRVADGEVAFEGERDDHEDGGAHRHVRHHVGVLHHRRQALCKINTQQSTTHS